ncbi:NUDIX domain-containing protein [Aurantimonas sp. Leaf443]|uniref:NUDIX hydrolase n=1 Tax=Aurantimonas sp. Leaf443 TaxID=1736378 RepID=UPI000701FD56|nr:NUDIX domain-containing protein [Aurantimonas sp. Leaf443]KQT88292.1 hypothetical protein ASG48_02375 [Aurantimonas sp. Leaf443]
MTTDRRPLLGVSIALFRDDTVLLVERGRAPFAGLLSLPGGRVEFGESLAGGVAREVLEETGLDVAAPCFVRFHEAIDAAQGLHVVIAVFAARLAAQADPVAGDDAASLRFAGLAQLAALDRAGRTTQGLSDTVRAAAACLAAMG